VFVRVQEIQKSFNRCTVGSRQVLRFPSAKNPSTNLQNVNSYSSQSVSFHKCQNSEVPRDSRNIVNAMNIGSFKVGEFKEGKLGGT
jgi:hypothetical protein